MTSEIATPDGARYEFRAMSVLVVSAIVVCGLGLVFAVATHDAAMAVDDAYITFRYAANLENGHGLRWNHDMAPVEGYTNFLHVVLLAALASLGLSHESAAIGIAIFALTGTTCLLFRLGLGGGGNRCLAPAAAIPAVLFALDPHAQIHASRGLETLLFVFLATAVAASLAATLRTDGRSKSSLVAAAACSVLAFLCRPDGLLLAAVGWTVMLCVLSRRASACVRMSLAAAATVVIAGGAYAAWKLAYFGHLLPNAFYMKADVTGFAGIDDTKAFVADYASVLAVIVGLIAIVGAVAVVTRRDSTAGRWRIPSEVVIAGPMVVAWLVYNAKILHEIDFNHRFAFAAVPLMWLIVAAMVRTLCQGIRRTRAVEVIAWCGFAIALGSQWRGVKHRLWHLTQTRPEDPYTATFRRLGQAIRETGLADRITLLCSHSGATPYVAGVRHIDSGGLTDDTLSRRTPPEERARYFENLHVDVRTAHVFPASPGAESFESDPRTESNYLREWLLGLPRDLDAAARLDRANLEIQQRVADVWSEMTQLRDTATLVGEANTRLRRWRVFVYVMKDSAFHDELVRELNQRVDIPSAEVDWDKWPE